MTDANTIDLSTLDTSNDPEMAAIVAQMQALTEENAALKKKNDRPLTLKVSAKKAVSLYGMGRFPVTLYANQWEKVLTHEATIREFIAANVAELAVK
jgi:hypothetical protein